MSFPLLTQRPPAKVVNLVLDPSFEYDPLGAPIPNEYWTHAGTALGADTLEVSGGWAASGKRSVKYVSATVNAGRDLFMDTVSQWGVPASPGVAYTVRCVVNVVKLPAKGELNLNLLAYNGPMNEEGTLLNPSSPGVNLSSLGIHELVYSITAPAGTTKINALLNFANGSTAGTLEAYADEFSIVEGTSPSSQDGDSPGCWWVGTPGGSISETSILSPYQFSFNGYTFGSGTPLGLKNIAGLDLPVVRSGDAGRPRDDGAFAGLDVLGQREVTIQGELRTDGISFGHSLSEARKAFVPSGMVEKPLYINYPAVGTLVAMARVRKRQMPVDLGFTAGNLASVTVLFVMTDPRFYGTTATTTIVSAVPNDTLAFPWAFPLNFGGGQFWTAATVTNSGETETRPRVVVEGPCHNPSIWNISVAGEPRLGFKVEMPSGSKLVIDTDLHTATYYPTGSGESRSVMGSIVPGSEWWALAPGANEIGFMATTGQVTLEYAPAYIL